MNKNKRDRFEGENVINGVALHQLLQYFANSVDHLIINNTGIRANKKVAYE